MPDTYTIDPQIQLPQPSGKRSLVRFHPKIESLIESNFQTNKFVSSVMDFYLNAGGVTHKQFFSVMKLINKHFEIFGQNGKRSISYSVSGKGFSYDVPAH